MDEWSLTFMAPWWLIGLVLIPIIVWWSRRSLAGLGRARRWFALFLRSLVVTLIVVALADVQIVRESKQICTFFVLDQSQSMPEARSADALAAISSAIARRGRDEDLAGLVVFGDEARIELPPAQYPRDREIRTVGSLIDRQYTDIGAGINLALGSLPPNSSGRLVVISDGNQNRGNAIAHAAAAAKAGVAVDVVPIEYRYESEVLVDKVSLPGELKKGDTANLKIVLRSGRPAQGTLRLTRVADGRREIVAEERIALETGLNVRFMRQTIDEPNFYTYEAQFEPDPDAHDQLARNNAASNFTWIRGEGRILFIGHAEGESQSLIEALRGDNLNVIVRRPEELTEDLAELRQFDSVIINNIAAEELGEAKQKLIAANTRVLGAGLVMIGGPDSFGPGGYNGSVLEEALPVEMEVKSTKVTGKGALVLIMHACEMPEGNFWQKKTAQLAVKQLSPRDECGVIEWNGQTAWVFKLQPVEDGSMMLRRIDQMTPSDMPDFQASMNMAHTALKASDALTKHTIIISDGDPAPPSDQVLAMFKQAGITCTTVAIAAHGAFERRVMRKIAASTGGRYYEVTNAKTLPSIYTKETRTISRPLIYEREQPWAPTVDFGGEPIAGIADGESLPPIRGFVMTTPKQTAVIEIRSPNPAENEVNPILAHWQYGLGRSVAFTSDAGQRWATAWPSSDVYRKFWSQLIRWTMRAAESDRLSIATQEKDGEVKVVVTAMDQASEFVNALPIEGSIVRPDMSTQPLRFVQTEPGKYEAQFSADQAGSFMIRAFAPTENGGRDVAVSAINVSYPPEYRDTRSNRDFLENVALAGEGQVIEWDQFGQADFFQPTQEPVRRLQDAWPIVLLMALVLFWLDVANRRIAIEWAQVTSVAYRAWAMIRRRKPPPSSAPTIERLRSIKSQVSEELRGRSREMREFELRAGAPSIPSSEGPTAPKPMTADRPQQPPATPEGDDYTSRLLKAKKKVWEERTEEKPPGKPE